MKFQRLQHAKNNGVVTFQINRPEAHNALSEEMWNAIPQFIQEEALRGTRVIILEGSEGNFGAGADLNQMRELKSAEDAGRLWHAIVSALESIYFSPLPVIAKIRGSCLGGSCLLASACDIRLAALDARFAIPVARLGIVLDDGCLDRLRELIGPAWTKQLIFSACTVDGGKAEKIGLVTEAIEPERLDEHCEQLALQIAENSPNTILECKRSLRRHRLKTDSETVRQQLETIKNSYVSSEFKERLSKLGITI